MFLSNFLSDAPPNSRLFIISGKGLKEDIFRREFEKFGKITDVWVVRDKQTNEPKGVLYISYSKTSEAALALEEMNGRVIEGVTKPIKVLLASNRRDSSGRDPYEDLKVNRLFVLIPKSWNEKDLKEEFSKHGKVDSVQVVRDKNSMQSRGLGYVKFSRAYHCALAYENCDRSFKPRFAEPKMKDGGPPADRDDFQRGYKSPLDHFERRSGAPGGYPYNDMDRGLKRGFDDFGSRNDFGRDRRDNFNMSGGDGRGMFPMNPGGSGGMSGGSGGMFSGSGGMSGGSGGMFGGSGGMSGGSGGMSGGSRGMFGGSGGMSGGSGGMSGGSRGMFGGSGGMSGGSAGMSGGSAGMSSGSAGMSGGSAGMSCGTPMDQIKNYKHSGQHRLHITAPIGLTQNYLTKLFNIVPGLEYCDLNEQTGVAYVRYSTPQCAAYAKERLDQFEYPIGSRIIVRFAENMQSGNEGQPPPLMGNESGSYGGNMSQMGNNSIRQAAMVLENAGINPDLVLNTRAGNMGGGADSMSGSRGMGGGGMDDMRMRGSIGGGGMGGGGSGRGMHTGDMGGGGMGMNNRGGGMDNGMGSRMNNDESLSPGTERVTYCNIPLPLPEPMVPESTPAAQRLFVVCQPAAVPERILRDAFSRFANLISIFLLTGRNFGYAKYSNKASARRAMEVLHGQSIAGQRLKVLEAEDPKGDEAPKRQKTKH